MQIRIPRQVERVLGASLPIGVDIGASGVKLGQVRSAGRRLRLVRASRVPSAPGVGCVSIDDVPTAARALESLVEPVAERLDAGGFHGKRLVLGVDDPILRVRSVRHPLMPDGELARALRLDGASRLGFADDEACELGWIRAGEVTQGDDVRVEVMYVGAWREPLERLVFGLARRGYRAVGVEPAFVATARCFGRRLRRAADAAVTRVLVDVGAEHTGVTITRGHRPVFHKLLDVGGSALTKAAAERMGLPIETVRDLRRRRMDLASAPADRAEQEVDPRVDRAVYDAVRPLLGDLAHEVNLCVRHYSVTFRGSRPESVVVCGGDGYEPRLAETIEDAVRVTTRVGRPLDGIEHARGSESERLCAFAGAIGLSLSAMEKASGEWRGSRRRAADDAASLNRPGGRAAA